ncbi:MAG TPA: SH3 domain-containing protein [Syntrophorhabdaceae bacterium]|nr:SH3 domain-containing protein [Syntrophorhabdaceae bacterium]
MNITRSMGALLGICVLAAASVFAAETGTLLKKESLLSEPFRDAKIIGSLNTGDSVEIVKKQEGWFQVKSGKGTGWVRMLSVRLGEARKGTTDTTGLLGLASGRAGTGHVVATTGIRGLNEEDLKAAKYNEQELKKMESFEITQAEARSFAAQGKLVARKVGYLPSPDAAREGH